MYTTPEFTMVRDMTTCSNCDHHHVYDDGEECPICDNNLCPSCDYCPSCKLTKDDMNTCECGSGEITDGDNCSQCFDEEEIIEE